MGEFIRLLERFRSHMPPPHRSMLKSFEGGYSIRHFISAIEEELSVDENIFHYSQMHDPIRLNAQDSLDDLKEEYNKCIECLLRFRNQHAGYAKSYIARVAENRRKASGQVPEDVKGTGGTDYNTHLRKHCQDTKKAEYNVPERFTLE